VIASFKNITAKFIKKNTAPFFFIKKKKQNITAPCVS